MALFNRAEFNVEPILEPSARNPPRNSCRRVGGNHWHDSTEHRSDPEHANVAFDSMDARCNCRMALIFLVVCDWTRVAAEHAGSPAARSACTIAFEARMDMGAHCRDTWDYRHDRDGFRDGASGAFAAPIDFSKYAALTVICAIACISATAGVVEEAGFRGFLISPIQRRHGWTIAILISGIMFFLDHHLSHAYATFVFLPFFVAISVVHGLLVKYSGSIRPSVLLHALADFIVIPVSYGLVGTFSVESVSVTGIDRQFIIWVAVMVICFGAFVPALRVLGARSETVH